MAKFLATHGTSYLVEGILMDAKSFLILVHPKLSLGNKYFEHLKAADDRGTEIKIVFSRFALNEEQYEDILGWKNTQLLQHESVNAQCYFNENLMILSSMSLAEGDKDERKEMGILLEKTEDEDLYMQAKLESAAIINQAQKFQFSLPASSENFELSLTKG